VSNVFVQMYTKLKLHTKCCKLQPLLLLPKIYKKTYVICGSEKTGGLWDRHEEGNRYALTLHDERV
jgi:hypothetical protein